tara:strand:+ start:3130 stop:4635 length:1506 start_codon:yes stop_codon:yes gene_type:complete
MGPRKGIKQITKTVASPLKSIGEFVKSDRTREYYAGSGATIVKLDTSTAPDSLTTQSFSGTPQTISDSNWQWVNFNDEFWGVQKSHKAINYDGTNWYDVEDLGAYAAPAGVTTFDPNCALGEFGRMWYGGITEDKGTLFYSDNLIGEKLNGGAAGSLDLKTVWGNDEIVGLASLENKIVIFGKQNIAIYSGALNPATMTLDELIRDTGLAGRDNVVYVGADLVFMSYEGLQSMQRIQQTDGKAPLEGLSTTVRNDLTRILTQADVGNIKSVYYQKEGMIITFMPDNDKAYVFDFSIGKKEFPRITTWTFAGKEPLCAVSTISGSLYMGTSDSVAEYSNYYDVSLVDSTSSHGTSGACSTAGGTWDGSKCWTTTNTDYSWEFQSPWLDLGDPVSSKIIKSGLLTITGGGGAAATIQIYKDYEEGSQYSKTFNLVSDAITYLWGSSSSLYGAAKYAPAAGPKEYKVPLARTGKTIRIKMTFEVKGNYSSLINTTLLTKKGKIR